MASTVKITLAMWLESQAESCREQLERKYTAEQLEHFQKATDDSVLYAGYVMGTADAAVTIKGVLERAHLADRKIAVPQPGDAPTVQPRSGSRENPQPLTIGALRAYLASRPDLSDDAPVIVGGSDFDKPSQMRQGLADAVWSDAKGIMGERLCIAAMDLGLTD